MDVVETAKLLYIVKANYPKYYKGLSAQEFEDMVYAWNICISDYDFNVAQAGLQVYLTSDTKGFPPAVGQIIDCIHKIQRDNSEHLTELDAWGMVYKAICNSNYHADKEYAKLPEIVQRAVGNPARLREWAQLDTLDVQTVTQSNFMRSFKTVQEQHRSYRKMPNDIKQMLPGGEWGVQSNKVIDMQEESLIEKVEHSEPDFISEKMKQFYKVMGY